MQLWNDISWIFDIPVYFLRRYIPLLGSLLVIGLAFATCPALFSLLWTLYY